MTVIKKIREVVGRTIEALGRAIRPSKPRREVHWKPAPDRRSGE